MAGQIETFGELVNEVLQFGFNDGPQVNRKRVENWINEAQKKAARKVLAAEFQETHVYTLIQGTFKYALPEGFLRVQDIYYPELVCRLKAIDLQQFDETAPAKFEGPPENYTIFGNELWVFPTPNNSTDTLEFRFIKTPAQLVHESDVPVMDKDYSQVLVDYAVMKAFEAEDDTEAAQAHKARWKEELDEYATDKQFRSADRPRVLDGSWRGSGYGGRVI
jgi:hypothetical protein